MNYKGTWFDEPDLNNYHQNMKKIIIDITTKKVIDFKTLIYTVREIFL